MPESATANPGDGAADVTSENGVVVGTLVEAVDGPAAIEDLVGKGMPVLTLCAAGTRGFRILSKITPTSGPVPVLRVSIVGAREQVVYRNDGEQVRVADVRAGDRLLPSFHYPRGYRPRVADAADNDHDGEPGVRVLAVESAGEEVVYRGRVKETGCMFLHAGILCRV
jgi:hypothetical protein